MFRARRKAILRNGAGLEAPGKQFTQPSATTAPSNRLLSLAGRQLNMFSVPPTKASIGDGVKSASILLMQ